MATEVIPQEEVAVVQTKIETMKSAISAIVVSSDADLELVAGHVADIKKMKKFVEQERDKYIKPAKEIIANAKEKYDPFIAVCDEVESALKDKAQVFMLDQQAKDKEAKEKEIKKVETGYQKPETAAKKIEAMPEVKKTAESDRGKLTMKMIKDIRIVDESKIPDEYYKPRELDFVKIRKVATAGVVVPGVEVFEKPQMAAGR